MSLFRIGQVVRVNCENHPRHNYAGRVVRVVDTDGDSVYRIHTAAGEMLVGEQWLQPDSQMRECDRPVKWSECAWQPMEASK